MSHLWTDEVTGQQNVPNVARLSEAKMVMARDRARNARQEKAELTMAKCNSGKWQSRQVFEGHCNHCWKWGHMEKECFTLAKKPRAMVANAEVPAPMMNLRQAVLKTLQLVDLFKNRLEANTMSGSGTIVAKLTLTLDSGAAVSAAPKSLEDDHHMQTEEPRSHKTATGVPCKTKDHECYRL